MKRLSNVLVVIIPLVLLWACSSHPYSKTNRDHRQQAKQYSKELRQFPPRHGGDDSLHYGPIWVGTTNFNLRKPNYVVIHHTAQHSVDQTLRTFTLPRTSVSSHYVIGRNGEVYQMLNDYYRAWHGGIGKWGNKEDLNYSSIGIELDNNGYEPFSEELIESHLDFLHVLKDRHGIPTANFIGHSDIAPSRKVDPNANFPWKKLAEEGFGLWYDDIAVTPKVLGDSLKVQDQDLTRTRQLRVAKSEVMVGGSSTDSLDITINPREALRIIGYDTSDMPAAVRAFKLHFIQKDIQPVLSDDELKILYNLYQKYL